MNSEVGRVFRACLIPDRGSIRHRTHVSIDTMLLETIRYHYGGRPGILTDMVNMSLVIYLQSQGLITDKVLKEIKENKD